MEINRRHFLWWCGSAAMGGLTLGSLGCGGKGFLAGTLMEAAARGPAEAPLRPTARFF
ncbi:MAG: hypothetical protein JRJ09_06395 [Deltaproteobacteria bacterium]|nr:hypothetical protein [Deltaproteobacteria bacterium]MBW2048144.1 hypothetical protein [Deltaproteobacteria bacterium]MBW2110884.1 hypothetical protein [Deltaproteobacteria bacterium]MBW2354268.1 hypothetical protein [Deltaproteobacteria bacterium]